MLEGHVLQSLYCVVLHVLIRHVRSHGCNHCLNRLRVRSLLLVGWRISGERVKDSIRASLQHGTSWPCLHDGHDSLHSTVFACSLTIRLVVGGDTTECTECSSLHCFARIEPVKYSNEAPHSANF